jgi:hypothetical protein
LYVLRVVAMLDGVEERAVLPFASVESTPAPFARNLCDGVMAPEKRREMACGCWKVGRA